MTSSIASSRKVASATAEDFLYSLLQLVERMEGRLAPVDFLATSSELLVPQALGVLIGRGVEALEQPMSDVRTIGRVELERSLEDLSGSGGHDATSLPCGSAAAHPGL